MRDDVRRVLMIAYYFPPLGLSGVQRTAKFAKFLLRYGWTPTVLTVEPTGYYAYDETLLKEVEEAGVTIVRTPSLDANGLFKKQGVVKMPGERMRKVLRFIGDLFFIPDTKIGWKRYAVRTALELAEREHFDLIFATAPPQTDFLIGAALKQKLGVPLVVDYRDSWLEYPFKYFPTPLHRWINKLLERKVLKAADRVVVTHRRIKESIIKTHPSVSYHDVTILPHGYDPEDLPGRADRTGGGKKMVVAHAGTFYGGRTPKTILTAFARMLQEDPSWSDKIEFVFVGNVRPDEERLCRELGISAGVTWKGYMEHRACVRELMGADVLWYALDDDVLSPGKLYEYFGLRKTILASVVNGYTKQLLLDSGAATCIPIDDVTAHERALRELHALFEKKKLPRVSQEFAEKFDRQGLAGDLARMFEFLMEYDRGVVVRVEGQG